MSIEITISAHTAREAREEMAKLLGATPLTATAAAVLDQNSPGPAIKVPDEPITQEQATEMVQAAKQRERGKPSPGSTRRTKAEIAEDEAADARDAELRKAAEETGAEVADKHVDEERGAISDTPEDRQDPNNPDAAQDAADEAAETAAAKEASGGKLTHDDFRQALGRYVKKFGIEAAQADGPILIAKVLGKEPNADKPFKTSDLPEDLLEKAIAGVQEMLEKNPFKRTPVEGGGMFG